MMSTGKKVLIAVICAVVGIPIILVAVSIVGLVIYNDSKPDNSKDPLIPQGYIEFDGEQFYGGGDWDVIAYYVYDQQPQLDNAFHCLETVNGSRIKDLFTHYPLSTDNENPLLEREHLLKSLSAGDYYYIPEAYSHGALIYYYDIQTKALYKIDYRY
ncbi:MAG: hypothetical protein IJI67_04780 [Clostridia bacterium]|nr:hypothetical protein [Clostridia bacterium]